MFTKLTIGGALVLVAALGGGAWALAGKKADNCCFPGSDCCYPGSPCCDDSPKAVKKVDCCADPTCPPGCSPDCPPNCREGEKVKAAPKHASGAKCAGGKCSDASKAD